jgi:hypothetical protein
MSTTTQPQKLEAPRNLVPFATRSIRLAEQIMKELKMEKAVIELFKQGTILKTNYVSCSTIFNAELMPTDKKVIADLVQNGLLAYHILHSLGMEGQKIDIESEHDSSTFERMVIKKTFLCVPLDIQNEAIQEDISIDYNNRKEAIENYIGHALFMAKQGYVFAYEHIEIEPENGQFTYIEIGLLNNKLIRVN